MSEWVELTRALLALAVVAALMLCSVYLIKKFGLDAKLTGNKNINPRLVILETRYIDPKNKLVLMAWDGRERLLLVSPSGNLLVESRGATDAG